jgi:hypothetical protein
MSTVEQEIMSEQPVSKEEQKSIEQNAQPIQEIQEAQKKRLHPKGIINSPWGVIAALSAGVFVGLGAWLGNNPQFIMKNINTPYAMLILPAAITTVVAFWLLFNFFKTIVSWCKSAAQAAGSYLQQPGSKFWIATVICLTISLVESGEFFNQILGSPLFGILGYLAALTVDVISLICILAKQSASRRNDKAGEFLYIVGLIICAGISTVANGYMVYQRYQPTGDITNTIWPYLVRTVGFIPPILNVFLGLASDYANDQASSKLDPEAYRISEENRTRFLEVQKDAQVARKKLQAEIEALNKKEKAPKIHRTFFLKKWLFPREEPVNIPALQEAIIAELKPLLPKMEDMPEPLNVDDLRATIIDELKPLLEKSEPVIDYQKVAPMIAEQVAPLVAPEPVNYDQIIQRMAPMIAEQVARVEPVMRTTLRATLVEEVKEEMKTIVAPKVAPKVVAPRPQIPAKTLASKSRKQKVVEPTEARLEAAFDELVAAGESISGRALSKRAQANRGKATEWLQIHHPEFVSGSNSGSEDDAEATFESQSESQDVLDPEPQPEPVREPDNEVDPEPQPEPAIFDDEVDSEPDNEVDPEPQPEPLTNGSERGSEVTPQSQQNASNTEELSVVNIDNIAELIK